ncbi:MAG: membrane protein insertion efficiency factor YidD [Prevotellaceae bacterium]|nr:membrane protein insertion efficiency factor YidD [Candidatus Minthosoma equi]
MNPPIDEGKIRDYCQHHELQRPDLNIKKMLVIVVLVMSIMCIVSYSLYLLAGFSFFLCLDVLLCTVTICYGSDILRFLVKCYQHYATENIRRQCSCMPSCSEYALLALDKYIWPKALWKIWRRVTHTCSMPGYHIDYP